MGKSNVSSKRTNNTDNNCDEAFKQFLKSVKNANLETHPLIVTFTSINSLNENVDISDQTISDNVTPIPKEPRPESFDVKTSGNWIEIADKVDQIAKCKVFKEVQGDFIKTGEV